VNKRKVDRGVGGDLRGAEETSNMRRVIDEKKLIVGSDNYYGHVWKSNQ
jgi:hypothetical protein